MKQLLKIRNLLSFILLLALLSACKGKQENSEAAQPEFVTDCSELQTQVNQLQTQVANAKAEGKEEGKKEALAQQEQERNEKARIAIESLHLGAFTFEALNLSYVKHAKSNLFYFLPDLFQNTPFLRGIYSNPATLKSHYQSKRFLIKAILDKLGLIPAVQSGLAELKPYTVVRPEEATFRAGFKENAEKDLYEWNKAEYWKGKGLRETYYGMDVETAALRWKFVDRRCQEAQDFHGQPYQTMRTTLAFIINDFLNILGQPVQPAPAGEGG